MKSRSYFGRHGIVLALAQLQLLVSGHGCLLAADGRVPPFQRVSGTHSLPSDTQAIITSYKFLCCGNITTWQTYVLPRRWIFHITFQVWRPSTTVEETGCYSLVGENRFTSISPGRRGLVSETPQPYNILTVQPGDVAGYNISSTKKANAGIQLDADTNINSLWYHTDTDSGLLVIEASECLYRVGTEVGRTLKSSTDAAPLLSVGISSFTCPPTFTISTPSSLIPSSLIATTTSVPIRDSATISQLLPTTSSPVSSLAPRTSSAALSTAVTVGVAVSCSAFLLSLLCTLALAIILARIRFKRQKTVAETPTVLTDRNDYCVTQIGKAETEIDMHRNKAYSPTYHVIDELCGSPNNTEYDPVYESVNMENEDYDYAEEPHYYT